MFGYKRPYYSRRKGAYSYGRAYKYYRRGTVARAAAGAAAAKRSDKSETYSCTINGVASTTLTAGQNLTGVTTFHPYNGGITSQGIVNDAANLVHGGAVNDRTFRMKCASYDEVKLESMKVTFTPAQLLQNNNITFTICTTWDRKATPKEVGFVGGADWMQNGSVPTPTEIYNSEGSIKSQMNGNTIYGYSRYCKASSILEKGGYVDSSILYNSTAQESPLKIFYLDAWLRNPCEFSPALYLCVYSPAALTNDAIIAFSYKVEYTFTFRNPKSDLDYFLLVESPGYVNPDAKNMQRGVSESLARDIENMYLLKSSRNMPLKQSYDTVKSLFITSEEIEKEKETKDEPMEIEDDPGTA